MKIAKPWVSWEELEEITGGNWAPGAHTHVVADISDWGDWIDQAVKTGSSPTFVNLTDAGNEATNIAAGTTGQRPGGIVGDMRYNATLGTFEVYTGAWESMKFVGDAPTAHAASHESGGGDAIDLLTFSNTGLRILDTGADHYLTIKPNENLSANRILNIITGDAARTITLSGNPTLADWFDQAVKQASHPHFASVTVGNEGLHVLDTNASHDLIIKPGSDLTADRILTLTTGNTARTITLNGNPTLNDWFDQAVKQASSPTFAGTIIDGGDISIKEAQKIVNADNASAYFQMPVSDVATISDKAFKFYDYETDKYIQVDIPAGYVSFVTDEAYYKFDKVVMATSFHLPAGVTPNLGWLSDVVLGSLEEGETIRYDQATAKFIDAWGIDYDNPRLVYKIYTEFASTENDTNDPWVGAAIGGGGSASVTGTSNHPGIIRFNSAGTLNDGYRFMTSLDFIRIAGAEHSEFCFKTGPNLASCCSRLGYQDSLTGVAPTDGVFIDIAGVVLSGKTYNNTANSTTGTTYNLAVNTWYRGKIAVNSDATEIVFILYSAAGVVLWTDTLAANIPTAAGRELGHGIVAWIGANLVRTLIDIDMMIATRAGYIVR